MTSLPRPRHRPRCEHGAAVPGRVSIACSGGRAPCGPRGGDVPHLLAVAVAVLAAVVSRLQNGPSGRRSGGSTSPRGCCVSSRLPCHSVAAVSLRGCCVTPWLLCHFGCCVTSGTLQGAAPILAVESLWFVRPSLAPALPTQVGARRARLGFRREERFGAIAGVVAAELTSCVLRWLPSVLG